MTLKEQLSSDLDDVFFDTDDFAVSITYRRGGASLALTAIVGSSVSESANDSGWTQLRIRDYLIKSSAFDFGTGVTKPKVGDRIIDNGVTYVVTQMNGGHEWLYEDDDHLILRIHTIQDKR